jgi:hypothetical protein
MLLLAGECWRLLLLKSPHFQGCEVAWTRRSSIMASMQPSRHLSKAVEHRICGRTAAA